MTERVRSWKAPALIAGVLIGVLALGVWLVRHGDRSSTGTQLQSSIGVADKEAAELIGRLQRGEQLTFHARYTATGDPSARGGALSVEVWRKPGVARSDTLLRSDTGTSQTATFVSASGTVLCTRVNDDPWMCNTSTDPSASAGLFGDPTTDLQGADVSTSSATIAGRGATCYSFARDERTAMYCMSVEGIMLKQSIGDQVLQIESLDESVSDDDFVPPAAVSTGSG